MPKTKSESLDSWRTENPLRERLSGSLAGESDFVCAPREAGRISSVLFFGGHPSSHWVHQHHRYVRGLVDQIFGFGEEKQNWNVEILTPHLEESPKSSRQAAGTFGQIPNWLVIGGERGERTILSLTLGDEFSEVTSAAIQAFATLPAVRSVWTDVTDHVLEFYVVVASWDFEQLEPVYEQERRVREKYQGVEMEFDLLQEGEEDWIPPTANRLLFRR